MSELNGAHASPSGAPSTASVLTVTQNSIVQPLLTDLYQITMAYSYWKAGKTNDHAVFDLFFRRNPFGGEFTVFAGLEECLKFVSHFRYSRSDIAYVKHILPQSVESEFYDYLENLDAKNVSIYAMLEGSIAFPAEPLLRIEGPLVIAQLLETTLLNLVNYASLMTTNATRYRIAARKVHLLEFGLRRAQGPDGGLSASRYAYMGGFDGTSNVLAGKTFNIPVKGTHAHSYVTSFSSLSEVAGKTLSPNGNPGNPVDFTQLAITWRSKLAPLFYVVLSEANDGEFAAFISFAIAFPTAFVALVDTYDVIRSGLLNFCAVAMALHDLHYHPVGIRLDSGDLAYQSKVARERFRRMATTYLRPDLANMTVIASNDLTEDTILSLNDQAHEINTFAIGTHLVTCQKQPALGCVYKMVEINGHARMKLSHDVAKVNLPGRKEVYRLYGEVGYALIDIMRRDSEPEPQVGEKVLCRHPFQESKRAFVTPTSVERLLHLVWHNGELKQPLPPIEEVRKRIQTGLALLRPDIKRNLNPTPYKVSVSDELYHFLHDLWLASAPIGELL